MKQTIQQTLRSLGITANYRGYRQLCAAIELVVHDEDRLLNAKRYIHAPVAEMCHCSALTIERNIRTLILRAWKICPDRIAEIAGFPLDWPPSTNEFIDYIANYVRCSCGISC